MAIFILTYISLFFNYNFLQKTSFSKCYFKIGTVTSKSGHGLLHLNCTFSHKLQIEKLLKLLQMSWFLISYILTTTLSATYEQAVVGLQFIHALLASQARLASHSISLTTQTRRRLPSLPKIRCMCSNEFIDCESKFLSIFYYYIFTAMMQLCYII